MMDAAPNVPDRQEIEAMPGLVLLEFGTDWCTHCQAAQPAIHAALAAKPMVRHIRIEDGPGRRLGRSYRVKLWPTLILLRGGDEISRMVRPTKLDEVAALLASA